WPKLACQWPVCRSQGISKDQHGKGAAEEEQYANSHPELRDAGQRGIFAFDHEVEEVIAYSPDRHEHAGDVGGGHHIKRALREEADPNGDCIEPECGPDPFRAGGVKKDIEEGRDRTEGSDILKGQIVRAHYFLDKLTGRLQQNERGKKEVEALWRLWPQPEG